MDIGTIGTTLFEETTSYISYIISYEGLVSMDQLSSMSYATALTVSEMNTLFPITEINE